MDKNKIYEKNRESLLRRYPEIVTQIDNLDEKQWMKNGLELALDGGYSPYITKGGRKWYLSSRYEPQNHAKIWAENTEYPFGSVAFLFGFSNGEYIRQLVEKYQNDILYMVYEPNLSLFKKVMEQIDCRDIFNRKNLILFAGNTKEYMIEDKISNMVNNENYHMMYMDVLPNYDMLFPEKKEEYRKWVMKWAETIQINNNTFEKFFEVYPENLYYTACDAIYEYSVSQLKQKFESLDKNKIPAILVSAGPSLDKNIMELKKAEGKAFIMVVDTALKSILKAGIHPDMTITIDPKKHLVLFEHEKVVDLPMIVTMSSRKQVIQSHIGKRFYYEGLGFFTKELYRRGVEYPHLGTGGSVANDAFSALIYMGFKTIIFVGQDLAFTEDKGHTDGAYEDKTIDKELVEKNKGIIYVDDNEGGKIKSELAFSCYREWFERQMERFEDMKFINATEGGAKISGTEYIPLKDAIERECQLEVDFKKIIDEIPPFFSEGQVQEIRKYLLEEIVDHIEELQERYYSGKVKFEVYANMPKDYLFSEEDVKKIVSEIHKINNEKEQYSIQGMLDFYVNKEANPLSQTIYLEKAENTQEEIRMLCNKGLELFKIYDEGVQKMKADLPKLYQSLEECKKKHQRNID